MNDRERSLRGAKILVMGIDYKPNIDDMRESPAAEIIELLYELGAKVDAVLKELRHATKKSGWGQLTQ